MIVNIVIALVLMLFAVAKIKLWLDGRRFGIFVNWALLGALIDFCIVIALVVLALKSQ